VSPRDGAMSRRKHPITIQKLEFGSAPFNFSTLRRTL
jgi:hypothetical protein